MDLLITGANGFLGSHLATQWLEREPQARVLCLVRGVDDAMARERLHAALRRASAEGGEVAGDAAIGPMLDRADAIRGDMDDPAWIEEARRRLRGPTEVIHCAANLSFRETDRPAVWRTNVDGTASLLHALASLPDLAGFNHISTAYVAGDRQGTILENDTCRPERFNNPYEESKWVAETLVRETCAALGLPWRVLRPSIIVAHSVTHRMSSLSGFYQVVDTLLQLSRKGVAADSQTIRLPVEEGTTLDLIPVDFVAEEVMDLIAAGSATANRTFHVTGSNPLRLADVLRELTPMSGLSIEANGSAAPPSIAANLIMRRLRHYMPYFSMSRRFDQANLQAGLGHLRYQMNIEKLRDFVRSYVGQEAVAG